MSTLFIRIKTLIAAWRELLWAVAALAGYWLAALALSPLAVGYSPDFLIKFFVSFCRIAVAVSLTDFVAHLLFPSVHAWRQSGAFRETLARPTDAWTPKDSLLMWITTAVYLAIFMGVCLAVNL